MHEKPRSHTTALHTPSGPAAAAAATAAAAAAEKVEAGVHPARFGTRITLATDISIVPLMFVAPTTEWTEEGG